jgi:hypothetical protein
MGRDNAGAKFGAADCDIARAHAAAVDRRILSAGSGATAHGFIGAGERTDATVSAGEFGAGDIVATFAELGAAEASRAALAVSGSRCGCSEIETPHRSAAGRSTASGAG